MTSDRSALHRAVEVGVFAPVGLAVIVCDQLPRLVETGRARVEPRLTLARFIGQMAVTQGRREIERRLAAARTPTEADGGPEVFGAHGPGESVVVPEAQLSVDPADERRDVHLEVPDVDELAIPAYESLSAGQIVPLLESLEPDELDLVGRFEAAHRHRRTILGRIDQLQGPA